jgi:hypothetical protein
MTGAGAGSQASIFFVLASEKRLMKQETVGTKRKLSCFVLVLSLCDLLETCKPPRICIFTQLFFSEFVI